MKSSILIAATSSGCGKTTLSLGLMRALTRKGLSVRPFKCGPDYIDTQFHGIAAGRPSINLDLFMSSARHVKNLYSSYSSEADVSVIEGVMGMFDGYDKMKGSSADMAKVTGAPIVLLVNAASTAFSVAATIYGYTRFCKDVRVAGVIFNRVASGNHFLFLRAACAEVGVECFGYIRRDKSLQTPSRHLGLTLKSVEEMNAFIDKAADAVEANVDIDALLAATAVDENEDACMNDDIFKTTADMKVAVACDEAFSFIYPANIHALGNEVAYFSPLHDSVLPDADLVYLPGGYPELFAEELERNVAMRVSVREFAESGGHILAECGGLIYLSESIDGRKMCGVLPMKATMADSKLTLGYRTISFPGFEIKGHEFHYSRMLSPDSMPSLAAQRNARGQEVATPLYRYKNVIAGYTHLYWGETDILELWKQ